MGLDKAFFFLREGLSGRNERVASRNASKRENYNVFSLLTKSLPPEASGRKKSGRVKRINGACQSLFYSLCRGESEGERMARSSARASENY